MLPRLKELYQTKVVKKLMERFNYKNIHQVPRILKVVINVGAGEAVQDPKILEVISEDLALITGQKPIITRARKAISAFKLRAGMPIGVKVTLRGNRMYEFLDRFFNFAAPRIRDFRGFPVNSFDGRGGYTLGISEQTIFPEIEMAKVKKVFGMDITILTNAKHDDEAKALLEELGMPFQRGK
ncbi:MAG: 50S ribosomal protein L5 [candidate division WOR-3 bacterium]|nr:50S ribosomal protein L5 [candidate division WOR-3 bacterium]MDW7987175.1 50S ribosomal protein L5 [candidate division WOR-3 bacterium]